MYGKHFESLYEGSMVGAGAIVFAVWGYVIARFKLDREVGAQVRLNSTLLGSILGEAPEAVQKAIDYLCEPDPKSSSKEDGGCRLVKIGEFDYRVVNGAKYTAIRNEHDRREQNRLSQQILREGRRAPAQAEIEGLAVGGVGTDSRLSRSGAFIPPTLDDVRHAAEKLVLPQVEAEKFFNYYESNGWRVGRNPMKSWRSSMSNWKRGWQERGCPGPKIKERDQRQQEINVPTIKL